MNQPPIIPSYDGARRRFLRRRFLGQMSTGLAGVALSRLLASEAVGQAFGNQESPAPKAKQVLQIFCPGAASHVDLWDHKPLLEKYHGTSLPGVATSLYLHSDMKANTRNGSGKLNRQSPTAEEPVDTFRADPAKPVPACPVTETRPMKAAVWGPVDQSALEDLDDILVYTSDTFTEPLNFAGNIEAKLFVSANTPDADWAVKLVDVRPDGFAQNIATGILRGRYRDSLLQPSPLEPGKIYENTVDLGPCAATIATGHRLRVDIRGSLFPLYDRNPNTGEGPFGAKTLVSTESVYHAPLKASRIVLPVKQ